MPESPRISLPKLWPTRVKSAMLYVISLAQFSMAYSRGWAADSVTPRLRLKARVDQLEQEVALLRDEIRSAVSHDILSFSARVLNTTASVGALTSFEG